MTEIAAQKHHNPDVAHATRPTTVIKRPSLSDERSLCFLAAHPGPFDSDKYHLSLARDPSSGLDTTAVEVCWDNPVS